MSKAVRIPKSHVHDLLVAATRRHADLDDADEAALRGLPTEIRLLSPDEDAVCQGERPDVAVFIVRGTLARYHTLASGDRQYLSLHIAADMPDVQSLQLKIMDHSVCALNDAEIACFRHDVLLPLLTKRPHIAFAFWRITLVDAAIFRQAISNNSARAPVPRMAHFCCEQYFRAREANILLDNICSLPLSQLQLGQTLGMSHISVNRALQSLRKDGLLEIRSGKLEVFNWRRLVRQAGFDPTYLHATKGS